MRYLQFDKKNTLDIFGAPLATQYLVFLWKMEFSRMKALSFYFPKLEIELKNIGSIKSYGSLKIVYIF